MPFPLPRDSDFRKEVVAIWIDDVEDRLAQGDPEGARLSWKIANTIYLELPPGEGCLELEDRLFTQRVKLDQTHLTQT